MQKPLQHMGTGIEKGLEEEVCLLTGLLVEIAFRERCKSCAILRFIQGGRGFFGVRERAAVLFWMSPMLEMANRSLSQFSTAVPLSRSSAERILQRRAERRFDRSDLPVFLGRPSKEEGFSSWPFSPT